MAFVGSVSGPSFVRNRSFTPSSCPGRNGLKERRCTSRRVGAHRALAQADTPAENVQPAKSAVGVQASELRSLLKKCPLYFVGCMGCGKTVVAKYVAFELGYRFLDTDELIEAAANKSVQEIFDEHGEDQFRDLESAVLQEVQAHTSTCIATGGGAVIRIRNWGVLHTGVVVWLNAPPKVLAKRLAGDVTRPYLAGSKTYEDREAKLTLMLERRKDMYAQADVVVPVGANDAVDDIAGEVLRRVANHIKENPPRCAAQKG